MRPRLRARTFFALALLACVLVAGVASFYASAQPDGLEFVAEQSGFSDSAEESAAADSPLADYQTRGVDDARLSGGIAGLVGVATMLVVSGALFWVLRRRDRSASGSES